MPRLLLILTLAALIAGCGLKGPLYFPGEKPASKQPAKVTPPAAADSKEQTP